MLTDEHVDHFRTFGFVVLRQQLDAEIAALSDEIDRAHRDAFGERYDERPDPGGISGHYLPVMSASLTPVSLAVLDHLWPVAQRLIGGRTLPAPAEAILFFDQAPWHDDTGFDVEAVKFATYLEPLTAGNGALRVLPGSHELAFRERALAFDRRVMAQRRDEIPAAVERLPAYVIDSEPGDVIAFDLRLLHASAGGRDRRQWTVTFYRDREDEAGQAELGSALRDEVAPGYGSWGEYDAERYPFYDLAWLAELERDWRRVPAERLRELGVVEAAAKGGRQG